MTEQNDRPGSAAFSRLDALTSKELHDRAWHHAEHHADVKFFWDLLEMVPAAEVAADDVAEAEAAIQHPSRQVGAAIHESPDLMDALRPVYIDYLLHHPDA